MAIRFPGRKQTERRSTYSSIPQNRGGFGVNWKTIVLITIVVVITVSLSAFFFLLNTLYNPPPRQVAPSVYASLPSIKATGLQTLDSRTNILLLGVDERDWDAGRSDTMILISVPADGSAISLISIPRDTMVYLPENSTYDKISHLYNYRGPEFSVNAVERLLDLTIIGHVVVNLDGFVDLIDELEGVTIDVGPDGLYYNDPYQDLYINLPPGEQRLDGEKAMHFVRFRADDQADIGRISRQQQFMQAVIDEFMAKKFDLTKLPGLVTKGMNMVTTDIPLTDLLALAGSVIKSADKSLQNYTLIGDGLYYEGISYYVLRYEESLQMIAEALFPEDKRQSYVLDHLDEPWVREYEWLRASLYADMLLQWQYGQSYGPASNAVEDGGALQPTDDPNDGDYVPEDSGATPEEPWNPDAEPNEGWNPEAGEEPNEAEMTSETDEEETTPTQATYGDSEEAPEPPAGDGYEEQIGDDSAEQLRDDSAEHSGDGSSQQPEDSETAGQEELPSETETLETPQNPQGTGETESPEPEVVTAVTEPPQDSTSEDEAPEEPETEEEIVAIEPEETGS